MIFSSAYATVLGVLVPLITPETVLISDELNHNCIINAMRLARPEGQAGLQAPRPGGPGRQARAPRPAPAAGWWW